MKTMNKINPRITVTAKVDKEGLQAQIDEQVDVLYSASATIFEKETAALNYRHLAIKHVTIFGINPVVN